MADYKKQDYWQIKAQKEGYPARSVYKLKEMDEKFGLLKPVRAGSPFRVLDLGAAPGSWSLYVLRKIFKKNNHNSSPLTAHHSLVCVDLCSLSRQYDQGLYNLENFYFIQGDITDPDIRDLIFSRGPYNLIISDAAPATSGNRLIDTARSLELAEAVVFYAENTLSQNGHLVLKIFQGGDSAQLLIQMKKLFNLAKSFKPEACRGESFETYYVGIGKKSS